MLTRMRVLPLWGVIEIVIPKPRALPWAVVSHPLGVRTPIFHLSGLQIKTLLCAAHTGRDYGFGITSSVQLVPSASRPVSLLRAVP